MTDSEILREIADKLSDLLDVASIQADLRRIADSLKKEDIKSIRCAFFTECTDVKDGLRVVDITPHNLFDWFEKKLSPLPNPPKGERK